MGGISARVRTKFITGIIILPPRLLDKLALFYCISSASGAVSARVKVVLYNKMKKEFLHDAPPASI